MPATAKRVLLPLLTACLLSACPSPDKGPKLAVPATPLAAAPPPAAATGGGEATRAGALPDFTGLVEAQGPAVVNVVTVRKPTSGEGGVNGLPPGEPLADFLRRFIPDMPPPGAGGQQVRGIGSGFIISEDGLLLTNAHVVSEARSVTIRLADGKHEFPGKVLGVDARSDVALVKIDAHGLPVASLGNSAAVKPGEWVAAIGSPFGFANTITAGIVSATNRELPNESIMPFIQTDVAVNPGNSGGPLINMSGQVIGMNSMIYSGTGGYMGVSFAIPIEVALDVAKQLQEHGKVTRGRLGVVIQPMSAELAQAFHLKSTDGVVVGAVEPGGPADRAGLKSGDVILEYNGQALNDAAQLPRLVAGTPPGTAVRLSIWRNGARQELSAKVGEVEPDKVALQQGEPAAAAPESTSQFGLLLSEVPAALREKLGIGYGLMVRGIQGAAADTPLQHGDVIVGVGREKFASVNEFTRLLSGYKAGDTVALLVRRGEALSFVPLKVPIG